MQESERNSDSNENIFNPSFLSNLSTHKDQKEEEEEEESLGQFLDQGIQDVESESEESFFEGIGKQESLKGGLELDSREDSQESLHFNGDMISKEEEYKELSSGSIKFAPKSDNKKNHIISPIPEQEYHKKTPLGQQIASM